MELDRDDPCADVDERGGQDAVAGAEVDDEIAGAHPGPADHVARHVRRKSVEAPVLRPGRAPRPAPCRGHGGP